MLNLSDEYYSFFFHIYLKFSIIKVKSMSDSTIIVGDFSIPLSVMDRMSRQKINKETED